MATNTQPKQHPYIFTHSLILQSSSPVYPCWLSTELTAADTATEEEAEVSMRPVSPAPPVLSKSPNNLPVMFFSTYGINESAKAMRAGTATRAKVKKPAERLKIFALEQRS